MTPLRKRTLDYMTVKGYAERTKVSYIFRIQQFALHFNSCPSLLDQNHVAEYLQYLLQVKGSSKSTVNITYSAIKILFVNVLDKPWDTMKLPRVRREQKLPSILSVEQVISLIEKTQNIKHRCILSIFYSSGIRKEELCQLKVKDILFSRKRIFIKQAKGNKDRYALLSEATILLLQEYLKTYRPSN
jgi:integrase/recombinase XerD